MRPLLEQLQTKGDTFDVEIEGFKQPLTHLDKLLWPAGENTPGHTKRDLLIYLAKISEYILPHLKDRPLTMNRFPEGIHGFHFYQRHWDIPIPPFVKTLPLSEEGNSRDYIVCNNLSTLIWLGQIANLEIHSWFSRIAPEPRLAAKIGDRLNKADFYADYPDFIIFDVDPYIYSGQESTGDEPELNRKAFKAAAEVALWLKEILDNLSLHSFIKTSGKTGLHIHVPVVRQFDYTAVRSAAKTIANFLLSRHPIEITTDWAVTKRTGKIYIDYNQNVRSKTLASIYSPRPTPLATVSTPLKWEELGKVYPTDFTIETVPARDTTTGDLWAGILDHRGDQKNILGI
jgi:bifunctional non-homologous end joining protein LigD